MTEQQARWVTRITDARAQLQTVAANERQHDRISPERLGRRLPSEFALPLTSVVILSKAKNLSRQYARSVRLSSRPKPSLRSG